MRFLLVLALLATAFTFHTKESYAEEAREYTDRLLQLVISNDVAGLNSFDFGIPEGQRQTIVGVLSSIPESVGSPLGYDLVEDWVLSENFHRLYYTLNFEAAPAGLAIAVYRTEDEWKVVDYRQYETLLDFFDALR